MISFENPIIFCEKTMMSLRTATLSFVGALLFTLPLHAADDSQPPTQPPLDRLKAAADLTALDGSGLKPWHWKMDVTVFDNEGKNPTTGSLEMWFSDGNLRSVESLGTKQITSLRIGNNLYRTSDDEKDMAAVGLIEMQVLHPIPDAILQPSTAVKMIQGTVGTLKLDCMTPTVALPSGEPVQDTQAISFCFEQGTPKMLVTQEPGNFSVLRPRIGMFQAHEVPVDLQTFAGAVMLSEAKTTKLVSEAIDPSMFKVQPDMGPVSAPVALPAPDLRGLILSRNPPVYPPEAKEHHLAGIVMFDATIGKDGHIASLQPMPQSNAQLIASAKDTVNHWLFRPYMVNGVPVEVKTQFTVSYGMAGRGPGGPPGQGDAPGGIPGGHK